MSNKDWMQEKKIASLLDQDEIQIPTMTAKKATSKWSRFIHYLFAPTKNPFDHLLDSSMAYATMRIIPLVSALFIALLQLLFI